MDDHNTIDGCHARVRDGKSPAIGDIIRQTGDDWTRLPRQQIVWCINLDTPLSRGLAS